MIKGLFSSGSAMIPQLRRQEVIANNLAKSATPGFKKDNVFVHELSRAKDSTSPRTADWQRPMLDQMYVDHSSGSIERTGGAYDFAIEGEAFFVTQGADGEEALTRNGAFAVDTGGFLVTQDGDFVVGDGGPIQLTQGEVSIAEDGGVAVDGALVGRMRVVEVEEPQKLTKIGAGKFVAPAGVDLVAAARYVIRQGYLESSNVEVVSQMIDMIASYRAYESDAQALKSQDESLKKLIADVARVSAAR